MPFRQGHLLESLLLILLDTYPEVELLGSMVVLCLIFFFFEEPPYYPFSFKWHMLFKVNKMIVTLQLRVQW